MPLAGQLTLPGTLPCNISCGRGAEDNTYAAQVAFWAALYLLRRAQWAVLGQPRPPKVHASPTVALLCKRADKEEAKQLSIQHGYDFNGMNPDAFLPSPPASLAAQLKLSSVGQEGPHRLSKLHRSAAIFQMARSYAN